MRWPMTLKIVPRRNPVTDAPCFIPADWPAPQGIVAGTTLRQGGVSRGVYASLNLGAGVGDKDAAVAENRRRFVAACDSPQEPRWLKQVHGTTVAPDPPHGVVAEADATVSSNAGVTCVVLTADCLPVIFATADGREVGAAHAGWRGLLAGVLEASVRSFSSDPESLLVWMGPAISQAAFEVGGEVRDQFLAIDPAANNCFVANSRGRWQADLYALARLRLAGVGVQRVSGGDFCTYGEPQRFFSYRRDGQCGRMASFVFRRH